MSETDPNQHIVDELNRFRTAPETFYALQIDAPWGSGKTHFIRKYIEDHCPKGAEDSPKNVVVSLFGMKSVKEIEQQISSQLFSGGERLAASVFSTIAMGASGFFKVDKAYGQLEDSSRAKLLTDRLKEVKNGIIVFDDVERCSMKMIDALGYINNFVEKEGFKVVLVSNEQGLQRKDASKDESENASALKSFREKLVGRTLYLKANPIDAYAAFVAKMRSEKAREYAKRGEKAALAVFHASSYENLRSLRIGLEAFDRIVESLPTSISLKDEGLADILAGCVYVTSEINAAVKQELVSEPTAVNMSRILRAARERRVEEPSDDEKLLSSIQNRYADVLNLRHPTVPFKILIDLVAHGNQRTAEIIDSIRISPLMNEPSAVPLWRRLIEIWDYNIDQFAGDSQALITAFSKQQITDPGELLHLAGIMLWREKYGDTSISDGAPPEDFITKYLNDLESSGKHLDAKIDVFDLSHLAAYGYVVLAEEDFHDTLVRIAHRISNAVNEAARTRFPETCAAIYEALLQEDRDFQKLLPDSDIPYLRMPIFKDAPSSELADIILRNGRIDAKILKWVKDRYQNYGDQSLRTNEQEWIDGLYNNLKDRISTYPQPLSGWWMQIVNQSLLPFVTPS